MSIVGYAVKKAVEGFFTIIAALTIIFFLINLAPGNPIYFIAGDPVFLSPAVVEYYTKLWGLDKPLYYRYFMYISNLLRGELGRSYRFGGPVAQLIVERLPLTLSLTITSNIIAFVVGTLLGLLAARKQGGNTDTALTVFTFIFNSVPGFLLGIVLMLVFGVHLKLFPVAGLMDLKNPKTGVMLYLDIAYHAFLPILTLTLILIPAYFKTVRDSAVQQLVEDYVTTFRAVGLDDSNIFRKHILRNVILPPITLLAIRLGFSLAGAALIENVFGWPGMGRLLLDSIRERDYPVLMGIYATVVTAIVAISKVLDVVYGVLDPRVKTGR
ncbi:MAG: ABC transporter permease [Sulfolobales archaeon]